MPLLGSICISKVGAVVGSGMWYLDVREVVNLGLQVSNYAVVD